MWLFRASWWIRCIPVPSINHEARIHHTNFETRGARGGVRGRWGEGDVRLVGAEPAAPVRAGRSWCRINDYEAIHLHILALADLLSSGIMTQFPSKFA